MRFAFSRVKGRGEGGGRAWEMTTVCENPNFEEEEEEEEDEDDSVGMTFFCTQRRSYEVFR